MERIDHISIAVRDLKEAERHWEQILGVKAAMHNDGLSDSAEGTALARFFIGDTALELLQSTTPNGEVAKFIDRHGEGIYLVAIKVDDAHKTGDVLKDHGVRILDQRAAGPTVFVHPKSTNGVLIELTEHAERPPEA